MEKIPDAVLLEQYRLEQDAQLEAEFAFELELFPSDTSNQLLILPRGSHSKNHLTEAHVDPVRLCS